MSYEESIKKMLVVEHLLKEMDENEQNAVMCASIEMLADIRNISPFELMEQYEDAIIAVKFMNKKER